MYKTLTIEQLKALFSDGDAIYGYTQYIEKLSALLKISLAKEGSEYALGFWDRHRTELLRNAADYTGIYNSREFKAYLIDVVAQGCKVISILNDVPDNPYRSYNVRRGSSTQYGGREITLSELGFMARYWDIFFKGNIYFYYFNEAANTFIGSSPIWELPKFPNWQQYYALNSTKQKRIDRREIFKKMFIDADYPEIKNNSIPPLINQPLCAQPATNKSNYVTAQSRISRFY
jgi:hypothetical protein